MNRVALVTLAILLAAAFAFYSAWRTAPALPAGAPQGEAAPAPEGPVIPGAPADAEAAPHFGAEAVLPPPVDLDAADRDLDLCGRVVDAEGAPVAGAEIESIHRPGRRTTLLDPAAHAEAIVDAETRSAIDGTFAIPLARGALREVRVTHPDYAETAVPACQAGERVEIVLHPGARIELRTVDEGGAPVADVQVRLWYRTPATISFGDRLSSTDERGVADIRGLAPGRIFLAVEHTTLGSPRWSDIVLAAGETLVHEVVMPSGRTVSGTVVDRESGLPIAGARIGEGWTMDRVVRTDADGRYRLIGFTGLGNDELAAEADGYGREKARVPEEEPASIDFELYPGDIAVGRVVDLDGAPLEGVRVHAVASEAFGRDPRTESRRGSTDTDGAFRIDALHPEMPHTLVLMASGFGLTLLDFDDKMRDENRVIDLGTIALPPAGAIEGELVDGEGLPVTDAAVVLSGHNADRWRLRDFGRGADAFFHARTEERRTDDLGRFRYPDLSPGEYSIAARPRGRPELREMVELPENTIEPVFVRLVLPGGPRFRIAVETAEGRTLPGVWVSARGSADINEVSLATDNEGIAAFEGLPGPVSVAVGAPEGFVPAEPLAVEPLGQTERVVLARAVLVSGVVISPDGRPRHAMQVFLARMNSRGEVIYGSDTTDGDGAFEFRVAEGSVVDLVCDGAQLWTDEDSMFQSWTPLVCSLRGVEAPAADLRLQLEELPADRDLRVRVLGREDAPLSGVQVLASVATDQSKRIAAVTDENGIAHLQGLYGVETWVHCAPPSPELPEGEMWIHPGSERLTPAGQEVTLRMRVGTVLLGSVVGPLPMEGVLVDVRTYHGRSVGVRTSAGRFSVALIDGETADLTVDEPRPGGKRLRGELLGVAAGTREVRIVVREE